MITTANLQLREATFDDASEIKSLASRVVKSVYTSFMEQTEADGYFNTILAPFLDEYLFQTIVMVKDNQIAGIAICSGNMIDVLLVDPSLNGQGYGSSLLTYCEAALFLDYGTIQAESFAEDKTANEFYAKHGWTEKVRFTDGEIKAETILYVKSRSLL